MRISGSRRRRCSLAFVTYVVLLILVASAQNSFASDNRSTRIRIAICVQTVLFIGWVTYGWLQVSAEELLFMAVIFAMIHWYVYGVLMSGENAKLSPRVRRQLPMSFLGRVFLTWFNPGSGTGYVFAISHVLLLMGLAAVAAHCATRLRPAHADSSRMSLQIERSWFWLS